MNKYKTSLKYVWLTLIVTILGCYFVFPQYFTGSYLKLFFKENQTGLLVGYIIMVMIRSIFFIPATVVLLIGIFLFPGAYSFLIIINMLGIVVGASLLYVAAQFFTPNDFFNEKKLKSLPTIKDRINKYGFGVVLAWSFFPLVPTDLICYLSGATQMKYLKFILAVFIGEIILVSIYVYTGDGLFSFLGIS